MTRGGRAKGRTGPVASRALHLLALGAAAMAWVLWRRTKRLPVALFGGLGSWWLAGAALAAL